MQEAGWGLNTPAVAREAAPPFLGVTVALEQYNAQARQQVLVRLQEAGFGWVRQRFDWGQMEPAPGRYRWQESDAILQSIRQAGLVPVVVLDGSPAWARSPADQGIHDNPLAPPQDPATLAAFAGAFARRYGDQVRYYQIWDEPNIAPHWGNRHIEPVAYAYLLQAAAQAIRAQDPDAVILTAALAPTQDRGHTAVDEIYFLQRLYAAGAAPSFDAVAVQPFGFGHTPEDPRQRLDVLNFQRVALIRRAMQAAGDGTTPIWAIRFGWNRRTDSLWGTVRPELQEEFAARAVELAASRWPWLVAMGWALERPATPQTDPAWGFALTPTLARTLGQAAQARNAAVAVASPSPSFSLLDWIPWCLLLAGFAVVLWRGWAAAALLPWADWRRQLGGWPLSLQLLLWGCVLGTYYLATWPPLLALCLLALAFLASVHPQAGLWLVAALLPFYFQHKEITLVDQRLILPPAQAALLGLVPGLMARLRQVKAWPLDRWDGLALAWLGINLAASLNVWHWAAYGRGLWDLALMPLAGFWAVRLLATTPRERHRMALALFGGGLLAALVGLGSWLAGGGTTADGVRRLVGATFSPNHTALYLVRTLFLGLGLAWTWQSGWRRVGGWLASAMVAVALALTASRGAILLGIPAGLATLAWLGRSAWLRSGLGGGKRWMGAALLATLLALAAFPLAQRLGNSATVAERLLVWQRTLRLWQDVPWLGVGPGGFFWRFPAYLAGASGVDPNLRHPHNLWLELAAFWGVAGLLWFGVAGLFLVRATRAGNGLSGAPGHRLSPAVASGLLAGLMAALAHAQVDAFMALADLAAWNWLALALLVPPWPVCPRESR